MQIPAALGLPHDAAQAAQAVSSAFVPAGVRGGALHAAAKGVFEAALSAGMSQAGIAGPLSAWRRCELISSPRLAVHTRPCVKVLQSRRTANERQHCSGFAVVSIACRAELDRLFEQRGTLRLQFPREDLGFTYQPPRLASYAAALRAQERADRNVPFVPRIERGCRLPHAWLRLCACALPAQQGANSKARLAHGDASVKVRAGAAEASVEVPPSGSNDALLAEESNVGTETCQQVQVSTVDLAGLWPGCSIVLLLSPRALELAAQSRPATCSHCPCVFVAVHNRSDQPEQEPGQLQLCRQNRQKPNCHSSATQESSAQGDAARVDAVDVRGGVSQLCAQLSPRPHAMLVRPDGHAARVLGAGALETLLRGGVSEMDLLFG
jgi:hypothetical protein